MGGHRTTLTSILPIDGNYSRQNDNDNDNPKKITRGTELAITVTMAKVIH